MCFTVLYNTVEPDDLGVIHSDSGAFGNAPESERITPSSSGFNAVQNPTRQLNLSTKDALNGGQLSNEDTVPAVPTT